MTKDNFILGEEWIYYKIYCGQRTADLVLTETLMPLLKSLLQEKRIDKWFFIRYNDPENHLRLRLHFSDLQNIGFVIDQIKEVITPYINNHSIHKIQTDTYKQETERYGKKSMPLAESLFYNDSQCIIQALASITDEELLVLFMLKTIDDLMSNFGFNTQQKRAFAQQQMHYYKAEQGVTKQTNKQLATKHRERKEAINQFLGYLHTLKEYKTLEKLTQHKSELDKPLIETLHRFYQTNTISVSVFSLLGSLIHMSVNRAFRSKQRVYEMLLYDFLERFYREQIGKEKHPLTKTK